MGRPLSRNQQLIWLGQQKHADNALYNMALAVHLRGRLDTDQFIKAAQQVDEHCACFSRSFQLVRGKAVEKRIRPERLLETLYLDDEPNATQRARAWMEQRARKPFDVSKQTTAQALISIHADHHVWFFNQHHLVTDAASAARVMRLMESYYCRDTPGLSVEIDDEIAAPPSETTKAYWTSLANSPLPPIPELLGCALSTESTESTRLTIDLGLPRTTVLETLAMSKRYRAFSKNLSQFQLLAAIVFSFIHRHTNERHLSLATPVAGRIPPTGTIQQPGLHMGVFPFEIQIDNHASLNTVLQAVKRVSMQFFTHTQPEASQAQLMNRARVLLNIIPTHYGQFADLETETEWLHSGSHDSEHPLRIAFFDYNSQGRLSVAFDFNNEVFDQAHRQWLISQFLYFMDSVCADPDQLICNTPLIDPDEQRVLLKVGMGSHASLDTRKTLLSEFLASVAKFPDAIALTSSAPNSNNNVGFVESVAMSYTELDRRTNQLAHLLVSQGHSEGGRVALLLHPSIDSIVAMLAVLKTGAAYLSLSPEDPEHRIQQLLLSSQATAILTQRSLELLVQPTLKRFAIDSLSSEITRQPTTCLDICVQSDSPAYLINTSGSTGTPKTITANHMGLLNLLCEFELRCPLTSSSCSAWWTSPSFDVSLYEIWSALAYGRTLHVIPHEIRTDTNAVLQLLHDRGVVSAFLPAFMLSSLAKLDNPLYALKRLLIGVEPIEESILGDILKNHPDLCIINGYGPAESTVCATLYTVDPMLIQQRKTPIGRPVCNTNVYVLDHCRQAVPTGTTGEIYIGGMGLAMGYRGNRELTVNAFPDFDPGNAVCERLYQTGDLGRFLNDGNLQYVGRRDQQIKIRGHRIEPAEIVFALRSHQGVVDAVIQAWPPETGTQIAAWVEGNKLDEARLRRHCEQALTLAMRPATYIILDQLPRNSSGKIDIGSLPPPNRSSTLSEPANTLEALLVQIWKKFLHVDCLGTRENFFDLGGDSIIALKIVAAARREGLQLQQKHLFKHQSIAELAQVSALNSVAPESATDITGIVPLSPIQNWFFEQGFKHPGVFNQQLIVRLEESVSLHNIQTKMQTLLDRHDAFHLRFIDQEQQLDKSPCTLKVLAFDDQAEASAVLNREFDLSEAPLIRAALVGQHTLVLVAHHLIVDSLSWSIIVEELFDGSSGDSGSGKKSGFAHWTHALLATTRNGAWEPDVARWQSMEPSYQTVLPIDVANLSSGINVIGHRDCVQVTLTREESVSFITQPQLAILTSLCLAIRRWTDNVNELVLHIEGHGRYLKGIELDSSQMVGWFTCLYPVRIPLDTDHDLQQQRIAVKEGLDLVPHQGTTFGLLSSLGKHLDKSAYSSDILFNYLGHVTTKSPHPMLSSIEPMNLIRHPDNHCSYLFEIDASFIDGCLTINWNYNRKTHHKSTLSDMSQHLKDMLLKQVGLPELEQSLYPSDGDCKIVSDQAQTFDFGLDAKTMDKLAKLLKP